MKRALIISLMWVSFSLPLFGHRTITVDLNGAADFTEIQPAIDDPIEDGDTVLVKPGDYVDHRADQLQPAARFGRSQQSTGQKSYRSLYLKEQAQ